VRHGIIRGFDSALTISGDQSLYVIGVRGVLLGELRRPVLRKIGRGDSSAQADISGPQGKSGGSTPCKAKWLSPVPSPVWPVSFSAPLSIVGWIYDPDHSLAFVVSAYGFLIERNRAFACAATTRSSMSSGWATPRSIVGRIYDPDHSLRPGMYVDVPHLDCLLVAALITVEGLDHLILKPKQLDGVIQRPPLDRRVDL
jgi:hypothetical protein